MRNRHLVLRMAAACALAGGMLWLIAHFSGPRYQGKSVSAWLDQGFRDGNLADDWMGDVQPDTSTARAIRAFGTDALPTLLRLVRSRDTGLRNGLRSLSLKYHWFPIRPPFAAVLHTQAHYGFKVLGPSAKAAAPELVALLHDADSQVRVMAAFCLGDIGPASADAVPSLKKQLESLLRNKAMDPWDWEWETTSAANALGEIGPAARPALSQIAALTNTGFDMTDGAARAALIKITGSGLGASLEPLKDTSNSTNWSVALEVVRNLGSNAAPAIPILVAELLQSNEIVQRGAIKALGRIHAHPEQCVPAIAPFLRSTNKTTRYWTLQAISAFGGSARQWAPTAEIMRCVGDSDVFTRLLATDALRRVDPEAAAKAKIPFDSP